MPSPLLSIRGLHKSYAVPVLKGIDFELFAGEVHAIVGANGAGKTTLCNILCGLTPFDAGQLQVDGQTYLPSSLRDAESAGIRIVMQELNLIDNLSIAENLFLTTLPTRLALIDFGKLFEQAANVLQLAGLSGIDPRRQLGTLGIGQQQLIEIARALANPCRILILDEPTAALTDPQTELLFDKIAELKAQGTGIIYISHRMNEIRRIADRITVLRDGISVCSSAAASISTDEIVVQMSGDIPDEKIASTRVASVETALRIRSLSSAALLKNIDLDIRYGEILGIGGLIGSGRTELLRAIFGADEITEGQIFIGDDARPTSIHSPSDAVSLGIGLVPEDRKQQGLLLGQSISDNITLASLPEFSSALGIVDEVQEENAVRNLQQMLEIKYDSHSQAVGELSGGNQQKVSIARWLMKECRIVLLDEPTRGVDIRAKNAIYALLRNLASQGKAIVVASSESRELMAICHRIAILSDGRMADVFERGDWSASRLTAAAFSAYTSEDAA